MERLSRLIVLISLLAAGAAYAWLAGQAIPWLAAAAAGAFVLSFALTRVSLVVGLMPALGLAYVAPAMLMVAFGTYEYHQLLVWLALLTGPVAAAADWRRWHVPAAWRVPVAAWTLVVAVTWPIVAAREVDFSLVAARTLDTPNGLLGGPPPLTAAWVISVAMGQLLGLLWLDLLWARFGADRVKRAERAAVVPLLAGLTLSTLAAIYQEFADIDWLNVGDWPSLDRAGGLMLDANSFGAAAAVWAPLAMALAWRLGRGFAPALAVTTLCALGVWASGSRTALLILISGLVALGVTLASRERPGRRRLVPLALLAGAAVVVAAMALGSDDQTNPLARLRATFAATDHSVTASAVELWARNGYGTAAAAAIAEHPWTGIGVGAFNPLSTDYAFLATGALIPPDNAQNWWRHQIAELGWLGAAPSLLASILLIAALVRGRAADERREAGTVIRGVLVGVGLASLFGVVTQHPALFLTLATVIYWLTALDTPPAAVPAPMAATTRWIWAVALAWPLVIAAGQFSSARDDLRVPARAARAGFPYSYGFSAPGSDARMGEFRWAATDALAVMRAEHAFFELTAVAPHPDAASDPVRLRVRRGAEVVADVTLASDAPLVRLIAVPAGDTFLTLATETSRGIQKNRALKIAGRWLREVPPGTPPETVVR